MALVEYRGGSRRSFTFVPEDTKGRGWRRMANALWEFTNEGRNLSHNKGEASLRPLVEASQSQHRSYREALV